MNSKLLRFSIISLGLLSTCFAIENITGDVVEDLFFYDGVQISGVTYPENLEATTGTSSVDVTGTGSVTVGDRGEGGMLRLIVWGGTTISSERSWSESDRKDWWSGEINSPASMRTASSDGMEFNSTTNHMGSQIVPLKTYGLGLGNETFSFDPSATLVLPISVPDFTKIWVAIKTGDTLEKIYDNDFCIVQNEICVVDVLSATEITLARERFDDCMDVDVLHGSMGTAPYCQISCDRGFIYNYDLTECVLGDNEDALEIFGTDDVDIEGATIKTTGEISFLAGPARQGYVKYTGSNAQRTVLDTTGLTGTDLQAALKQNASIAFRNLSVEEDDNTGLIASLKEQLNNVQAKIWTWENPVLPEGEEGEARSVVAQGEEATEENDMTTHASAPLLPSTGPAGIFVGLAALGFGLMAFSRRREN